MAHIAPAGVSRASALREKQQPMSLSRESRSDADSWKPPLGGCATYASFGAASYGCFDPERYDKGPPKRARVGH